MEMENIKIRNREVRVKRSFDKKSSTSGRFSSSKFNPKSYNAGPRFNKSQPEKGVGFRRNRLQGTERRLTTNGRGRDFGGIKSQGGFNRRNDAPGFQGRNNTEVKNKDNTKRLNQRESSGGFKSNVRAKENSFCGSTVENKNNRNNQVILFAML